jgi:hypothetical protein
MAVAMTTEHNTDNHASHASAAVLLRLWLMPEVASAPFWPGNCAVYWVCLCLQLQIAYHSHCQNHFQPSKKCLPPFSARKHAAAHPDSITASTSAGQASCSIVNLDCCSCM